ncbi:serine hydrolase domain-containing protein [Flavobacterium sp. UBA6135]|uniref:serine hydrolase domain-containing protein n=1 Tax=Flavobacterium sp. UBA6135 TaxID=1946553 RepID=UPI0025C3D895|nr:serine hydrolase domain-containing protein [Flavobacterium sp. UBA6135]
MPKTLTAVFLIAVFLFQSCKKEQEKPLLAEALEVKKSIHDSLLLSIPFQLNSSHPSEEYMLQKKAAISNFYTKTFEPVDFSGSFLVAKNGVILYEKYRGFENFEKKIPVTSNSSLHVASISKVITATAILKLVQDNHVQLDQTVQSILPDFPYEKTTIRTLLNHRSGLPHYSRFPETIKGWNSKKVLTNHDVLDYLKRYKLALVFKNDTKFNYCNTNYVMLALIIEKVTQKSYAEALNTLIFEPLKMKNTFVFDYLNQKNDVSQSYKSTRVNYGWDQFDALYGDKNIYTNPRDLATFDLATYSSEFLRKNLWEEALKGYSYEKRGVRNYGLGIRMNEWETGQHLHYHNGWWHGSTSSYVTIKKDTVVIIGISNKYTQKTYQSIKLSRLFGDYPYELDSQNVEQ